MNTQKGIELFIGGVYLTNLDGNPVRVILFDSHQVFYEIWWDHCNDWSNRSNLKGKVYYYRTSAASFIDVSVFLRIEPLSQDEFSVHRPDLPFSACCNGQLRWTDETFSTLTEYEEFFLNESIDVRNMIGLNMPEVILVPFGIKGGYKKSVLTKSSNGGGFSAIELLWNAQNVQATYIDGESNIGVGLHRLGYEKRIPSFYIGSNRDNYRS